MEVRSREDNVVKNYIGMTANTLEKRYRNHKNSFNEPKYKTKTELPNTRKWKLKLYYKQYDINGPT